MVLHHPATMEIPVQFRVLAQNRFGCRVMIRHNSFNLIVKIDNRRSEICFICDFGVQWLAYDPSKVEVRVRVP